MTVFELADAFGAVRPVAVLDVAGQRPGEGVPVDVVGVVDDELADREEVALDGVEVAGVGRGGNQLDLVGGGEGADVRCPVGREVVLDPVDPSARRDRRADLREEREVVAAAPPRPQLDTQTVVMDVVGAHHVADAVRRCALTLWPLLGRPAGAGHRAQADRAHLVKGGHRPAVRWRRGP